MAKTIIVDNDRDILNENSRSFQERRGELSIQDELEDEALRRDRKSAYKRFAQINIDTQSHYRSLLKENPNAGIVLSFIIENMGPYNSLICSTTVMVEALGISRSSVIRAVNTLKKRGYIYVMKSSTTNVYVLNYDFAWKSWGNNMRYCKFPANVILSESEQTSREKCTIDDGKHVPRIRLVNVESDT